MSFLTSTRARTRSVGGVTRRAAEYWSSVTETWLQAHPQRLWRVHTDTLLSDFLEHQLAGRKVECILKTDLFDEVVNAGLFPCLASHALTVVGIDISSVTVQAAQARHPSLQAACADVLRLPFADRSFDLVVSNSTLDHFADLNNLVVGLSELHRVLRPGGELLLTLDNLANPIIAIRNALPFPMLNRLGLVPYYVGATCGPVRLLRLLLQSNFEVRAVGTLEHSPRVLTVALAGILERHASPALQTRFIEWLRGWERLSTWPGRFLTGHYITVSAIKA